MGDRVAEFYMRQSRCVVTRAIGMKSNRNSGVNDFGLEVIVFYQLEMEQTQKQSRNISKISVRRANARPAIHPPAYAGGIPRIWLK